MKNREPAFLRNAHNVYRTRFYIVKQELKIRGMNGIILSCSVRIRFIFERLKEIRNTIRCLLNASI